MLIERVDPRADDVRQFFDVYAAAQKVDDPHGPPTSYTDFRGRLIWGDTGDPMQTWLGWSDDRSRLLGGYTLMLPKYDNPHLGWVEPVVHPEERRRGHGRTLADHARAQVRESGRRLLAAGAVEGSPGLAFCDALGAERASIEHRNVLDLADVDEAHIAGLLAEAREAAGGYSVLSWIGEVPKEHLDGVAPLLTAISDAPVDQLEWQGEAWSPERVRAVEKSLTDTRARRYTIVARHDASGVLAGLTQLYVSEEHYGWAGQGHTAVLPEHRGHRLGLLMKAAMLPWLREQEPDVRRVVTTNAESNSYMLRVNHLLGYRLLDRWFSCQLEVG
ncbi:MAG: GNAT family N-acetyltransferase [Streptosporangiales bacterium]|nr:GNAT family N-acetyltransferase [Streptosporangiales bacterium]